MSLLLVILAIIFGLVALVLLLLLIRAGVTVKAESGQGPAVLLQFGFIRYQLYPQKTKPKKAEKPRAQKPKAKKPKTAQEQEPPSDAPHPPKPPKGSLLDGVKLKQLLPFIQSELKRLLRKLRFDVLKVHAVISLEDAKNTALAFGGANALADIILPFMDEYVKIKKQSIRLNASFDGCGYYDVEIKVSTVPLFLLFYLVGAYNRFKKLNGGKVQK